MIAAEVVFALRHEFAVKLTDIVHRRLMIGLSANQGEDMSEQIAAIAAEELNWNTSDKDEQLSELRNYNARLKVASSLRSSQ